MKTFSALCFAIFLAIEAQGRPLQSMDEILKKFNRQDGLIFDAPIALKKFYAEEQKKSIQDSFKPQFNLELSNALSKNILQMAQGIGSRTTTDQEDFVIFSPLSIAAALALLLLGSNGRTNDELLQLFGFNDNSIFHNNPMEIHDQFGLLIEDLLKNSQHPDRIRPVDKWKIKHEFQEEEPTNNFGKQHKIELASGIFLQKGFSLKSVYKNLVESIYNGEIKPIDFHGNSEEARRTINDWAQKKTNGKIHEIISGGVPTRTNMILASTLYFKGLWENAFISGATSKRYFYPNGKKEPAILAEMMVTGGEFPYYDAEEYGCRIMGFPYKGNQSTMYIILPYDSNRQNLGRIQQLLSADKIEEIISKMENTLSIVVMPKMHLESSLNLKNILNQMGVHSLFSSKESDLSLITDGSSKQKEVIEISRLQEENRFTDHLIFSRFGDIDDYEENSDSKRENYRVSRSRARRNTRQNRSQIENLFVDDILHKADLSINEAGTEGAAATVSFISRHDVEVDFRIDGPFLMLIRHDATKLPLFYGSVFNPAT